MVRARFVCGFFVYEESTVEDVVRIVGNGRILLLNPLLVCGDVYVLPSAIYYHALYMRGDRICGLLPAPGCTVVYGLDLCLEMDPSKFLRLASSLVSKGWAVSRYENLGAAPMIPRDLADRIDFYPADLDRLERVAKLWRLYKQLLPGCELREPCYAAEVEKMGVERLKAIVEKLFNYNVLVPIVAIGQFRQLAKLRGYLKEYLVGLQRFFTMITTPEARIS